MVTLQALTVTAVMRSNTLGYKGSTMNTKHTTGPWKFRQETSAFCGAVRNDGSYETIGHLSESYFIDEKTREANARLIAAAPDLLAMLERVTNEYRLLGNVAGLGDENPTVSEARALIAQIKGE